MPKLSALRKEEAHDDVATIDGYYRHRFCIQSEQRVLPVSAPYVWMKRTVRLSDPKGVPFANESSCEGIASVCF
jgi:hypothetical protein